MWNFALDCVIPYRRRHQCSGKNSDHNQAWLLAEPGGVCGSDEPHSAHSSFRFNPCSHIELESAPFSRSRSPATVLMVNLDSPSTNSNSSRDQKRRSIESPERSISPTSHSLIRFSYSEILHASKNFSEDRVLGRGALSCVFRGRVGYLGKTVAIKQLNTEDKESSKSFCRELMIASSLHNPHIVPLVGFCIDAAEGLFLVYKYVSGGSLEQSLHEKKSGVESFAAFPWDARYKVALGIAEAIEYLHNGTQRCVIHRDIKPSNILLSSRMSPKLCDFGLAIWTPAPSVPFLCKTVKGTFGYLAPEYFQHEKVSDKTDVYAFGVVLLELITGRKPLDSKRGSGEENLVSWAKPLLQLGYVEKLVDPRIKSTQKPSNQIVQMTQAARACINNEESRRPDMGEIIRLLRGKETSDLSLSRKKTTMLTGNTAEIDHNFPFPHPKNNDMKNHFAMAMLGVEFEDEDHFHLRQHNHMLIS